MFEATIPMNTKRDFARVALTPRPGGGALLTTLDSFGLWKPAGYFRSEMLPRVERILKTRQWGLVHEPDTGPARAPRGPHVGASASTSA